MTLVKINIIHLHATMLTNDVFGIGSNVFIGTDSYGVPKFANIVSIPILSSFFVRE